MLFPERKERNTIQEIFLFDRYSIVSVLRENYGSTVYLVRHQKLGEYRAVKRISKKEEFAWQIREADILNHLRHPQIPIIYDIEEDEEYFYIIEEYIAGESLEALMLQSSYITLEFLYQTILEVAEILMYLHNLAPTPLIYQDLKGEHIILGRNGVKLIDFGIASYLGETGERFHNYGTPRFCAPEKISEGVVDTRTDIYSLGKLMEQLILSIAEENVNGLLMVAKKAGSEKPEDRYAAMEEFIADLKYHMKSNQKPVQKHLLKKIAIAGSQPHVGCTHIAMALTGYLNRKKLHAVYVERNPKRDLWKYVNMGGFAEEDGIYRQGNFTGIPMYGPGVLVKPKQEMIEILDYGSDINGAVSVDCDLRILVCGSSRWEEEYAWTAYEAVRQKDNLIVISNFGRTEQAKAFAAKWKQKVYAFPLDLYPLRMTRDKERLFADLLDIKGGEIHHPSKSHWNYRKHSWLWSNPLSSCIGKLFRQRPR